MESTLPKVNVLDIPVYAGNLDSFVQHIVSTATEQSNPRTSRCVSATGAHGLIHAKDNKAFAAVLKDFYTNVPDGMPCVWVGRLKGKSQMRRCYGPDLFRELMVRSASLNITFFLCGGKDGIAEELRVACADQFGNSHCVGVFSPPFRAMTEEEWCQLATSITNAQADIVWIGLSTPKQEVFARELAKRVHVHFIITVGAAFDMHTGHLRQAPQMLQKLGLEWLFRLLVEPKRLYRRYISIVPRFLLSGIQDVWSFRRNVNGGAVQ